MKNVLEENGISLLFENFFIALVIPVKSQGKEKFLHFYVVFMIVLNCDSLSWVNGCYVSWGYKGLEGGLWDSLEDSWIFCNVILLGMNLLMPSSIIDIWAIYLGQHARTRNIAQIFDEHAAKY